MAEKLSIVFPLGAALMLLLWLCGWFRIRNSADLPAEPSETDERKFSKADWLVLLGLCAVYAAAAFMGLGDKTAPQSFLHFPDGNYYAMAELKQPQELSGIRYYSTLNTGEYTVQFSMDGETWTDQTDLEGGSAMTQEYTQLLRWNDAQLIYGYGAVRYVRFVSSAELYLGEVALYDMQGELIPVSELIVTSGCEALFDEQDTVPERSSFHNGTYFDEIYHPRTAYEHILGIWPYEITHPPLGKLIIGLGVRLFGMTPFGWRFMGALFGVLMLPALYILLKRMFASTAVALCGTAIFAFDFMHFTQTRIATIDTYAVFFTILMTLFMYLWLTEPPERGKKRLLWLGLCGLSFGLGAASKWTCFYSGAGLGMIWLGYWIWRFRREKKSALEPFAVNVLWCLLFFIVVPAAVYYASYYPYGRASGLSGLGMYFKREYLQIVLDNQSYMWNYHSGLVATHPYASRWYQWLLDIKPILYCMDAAGGVTSSIAAFNNPLLSWGGLCAMAAMVWMTVKKRDKLALFILAGYVANLLPWVLVSRLTFAYHYFPSAVFLTLALCRLFDDLRRRDAQWRPAVYGFTGSCVVLFTAFYPVLSGAAVSTVYTGVFLRWFSDTWPF